MFINTITSFCQVSRKGCSLINQKRLPIDTQNPTKKVVPFPGYSMQSQSRDTPCNPVPGYSMQSHSRDTPCSPSPRILHAVPFPGYSMQSQSRDTPCSSPSPLQVSWEPEKNNSKLRFSYTCSSSEWISNGAVVACEPCVTFS